MLDEPARDLPTELCERAGHLSGGTVVERPRYELEILELADADDVRRLELVISAFPEVTLCHSLRDGRTGDSGCWSPRTPQCLVGGVGAWRPARERFRHTGSPFGQAGAGAVA